jgi:hypothetical protein
MKNSSLIGVETKLSIYEKSQIPYLFGLFSALTKEYLQYGPYVRIATY